MCRAIENIWWDKEKEHPQGLFLVFVRITNMLNNASLIRVCLPGCLSMSGMIASFSSPGYPSNSKNKNDNASLHTVYTPWHNRKSIASFRLRGNNDVLIEHLFGRVCLMLFVAERHCLTKMLKNVFIRR